MDTDRNLLFGVIALQLDLIDRDRFAEACAAWAARKSTPLADLLLERGWLTLSDKSEVDRVLQRRLSKHRGDAKASLAHTVGHVQPLLAGVADPELQRSLTPPTPPQGMVLLTTLDQAPGTRTRYTLSRLHAQGGIGQVWLARDDSLGRDVALKELRPERATDPALWARFLKEAQITGQLEHPGIVPIYELGRMPGNEQPFYTMRFVRGRTLTEAIRFYHERRQRDEAGPLEMRELLTAFVGVCNAVAYAHSRGVIHRDLKPSNVVLGDYGEVMVLDWGLAKVVGSAEPVASTPTGGAMTPPPVRLPDSQAPAADPGMTHAGQLLGTPAYMAPEQADGRLDLLDARTDVYGLGAILYELLTGTTPFRGESTEDVLQRIRHEPAPRPTLLVRGTPPALEAICLKAMTKAPAERYASASAVAKEVQRWLGDEPVEAYPDPLSVRVGRLLRRYRTVAASAVVLLFSITVTVSIAMVLLGQAYAQRAVALQNARDKAESEAVARAQAEKSRGLAIQALSTLVDKVQENIRDTGGMRPLRQALLREALTGLTDIATELKDEAQAERHLATAYQHMSSINVELGDSVKAREYVQLSVDINERLAKANPHSPRDLTRLGITLSTSARHALAMGGDVTVPRIQLRRALELFDAAEAEAARMNTDPPRMDREAQEWHDPNAIERHRAYALDHLGEIDQRVGDLKSAKQHFLQALAIYQRGMADVPPLAASVTGLLAGNPELGLFRAVSRIGAQPELGTAFFTCIDNVTRSLNLLGEVAIREGDVETMHRNFLRSLELTRTVRRLDPGGLKFRWTLVTNTGRHGELCIATNELDKAEEYCRAALRLARDLRDIDPGSPEHDLQVSLQHYRLGVVADKMGDRDRALAHFNECLRVRQNLVRWRPRNENYRKQVMLVLPRLGEHKEATDLAAQMRRRVAKDSPELVEIAAVYAMCIPEVGRGKAPEALTESEKGLRKQYADTFLAILRDLVAQGFSDWGYLQIEVDFDGIRANPEFQALIAKLKLDSNKK
jgi:serine/threonine protein kinase/tetratricopeptide (TPR) repeat protein